VPLWCLGRELLEYRPYVPITHGLRIGTAVLSYNGRLFVGCTGDADTTPDIAVLARSISASVDELVALADTVRC
jgi:diacylglycerol O-acyltransferase